MPLLPPIEIFVMAFVAIIADALPHDALGWAGVGLALALYAGLIALGVHVMRRQRAKAAAAPRKPAVTPVVSRDRDNASNLLDTSADPVDVVAALHAAATRQIDAIDYALDRLFDDCAALMTLPPRSRDVPAPVYVLAQPAVAERRILAA